MKFELYGEEVKNAQKKPRKGPPVLGRDVRTNATLSPTESMARPRSAWARPGQTFPMNEIRCSR